MKRAPTVKWRSCSLLSIVTVGFESKSCAVAEKAQRVSREMQIYFFIFCYCLLNDVDYLLYPSCSKTSLASGTMLGA